MISSNLIENPRDLAAEATVVLVDSAVAPARLDDFLTEQGTERRRIQGSAIGFISLNIFLPHQRIHSF